MYISVITDQIDADLNTALRTAKEYGYHDVELHNVFGKSIEQCSDAEVEQIKSLLAAYDCKVSCIASTVFFLCPLLKEDQVSLFNPEFYAVEGDMEEHLHYLKRACEIAKALDCPRIRIFPFRFPDNREPYFGTKEQIELIMEKVKKAVAIAETYGVRLVLENCPYSHLPKGAMTIQIVKAINSDALKLLWDPANSYRAVRDNVPPEYLTTTLSEECELIAPWIDHVHIKNYTFDANPALKKPFLHTSLAEGDIDFAQLFAQLNAYGYQGAVSLEAETPWEQTQASLAWMEKQVSALNAAEK